MDVMVADELIKLKQLLDMGAITEEEFNTQKEKLLANNNNNKEKLYKVTLVDFEQRSKIQTIQVVRELTGLGLADAKQFVESLPRVIQKGLDYITCNGIESRFQMVGARVVIEEDDSTDVRNNAFDNMSFTDSTSTKPTITCPYCHSTNVEKITMGKKAVKGWLWGVAAASTLTKEWHCKNCKSNF